jgi:hypothetical protein
MNSPRQLHVIGSRSRVAPRWALSLLLALTLAEASAGPVFLTAPGEGATNDLFDVRQGARVVWSTPQHNSCCGESDPRLALGLSALQPWTEPGHAIFADGPAAGFVDRIEWQTAGPVNLTNIRIWLSQDGPANPFRGASAFQLLASQDGLTFAAVSAGRIPLTQGANTSVPLLIMDNALSGVTTNLRVFRLELSRLTAGGPRLIEVDGFGTPSVSTSPYLDRLAFNAAGNRLTGRGGASFDDEGPGLATQFAASGRLNGTDRIEAAFGKANGSAEPGVFAFAEGGVPDNGNDALGDRGETVDFIEWSSLEPLSLAGYRLESRGVGLVRFLVDGVQRELFHNQGLAGTVVRSFSDGPERGRALHLGWLGAGRIRAGVPRAGPGRQPRGRAERVVDDPRHRHRQPAHRRLETAAGRGPQGDRSSSADLPARRAARADGDVHVLRRVGGRPNRWIAGPFDRHVAERFVRL